MSRTRLLALSALLFALACNETKPNDAKKSGAAEGKSDASAGEPASSTTGTGTTGTSTSTTGTTGAAAAESETEDDEDTGEPAGPIPDHFDEIGVAVCDQYVKDYLACIDAKIPEADRETHRRTLADNHASWTQTMKGGESAATALSIGCRAAREQAKGSTTNLGCAW